MTEGALVGTLNWGGLSRAVSGPNSGVMEAKAKEKEEGVCQELVETYYVEPLPLMASSFVYKMVPVAEASRVPIGRAVGNELLLVV
jgi:DUF1365 family protein